MKSMDCPIPVSYTHLSYGKKGDKIVNMNYEAVDAGINPDILTKVEIPADWENAQDEAVEAKDAVSYTHLDVYKRQG